MIYSILYLCSQTVYRCLVIEHDLVKFKISLYLAIILLLMDLWGYQLSLFLTSHLLKNSTKMIPDIGASSKYLKIYSKCI